jgi:hypothetical protein
LVMWDEKDEKEEEEKAAVEIDGDLEERSHVALGGRRCVQWFHSDQGSYLDGTL